MAKLKREEKSTLLSQCPHLQHPKPKAHSDPLQKFHTLEEYTILEQDMAFTGR